MARVNEGSHSFTCHPHVYPQMELTLLPSHWLLWITSSWKCSNSTRM